jgi:hypothetical protein
LVHERGGEVAGVDFDGSGVFAVEGGEEGKGAGAMFGGFGGVTEVAVLSLVKLSELGMGIGAEEEGIGSGNGSGFELFKLGEGVAGKADGGWETARKFGNFGLGGGGDGAEDGEELAEPAFGFVPFRCGAGLQVSGELGLLFLGGEGEGEEAGLFFGAGAFAFGGGLLLDGEAAIGFGEGECGEGALGGEAGMEGEAEDDGGDGGGGGDGEAVAAEEAPEALGGREGAGDDGKAGEEAFDVIGEPGDGGVAEGGVGVGGVADDGEEVRADAGVGRDFELGRFEELLFVGFVLPLAGAGPGGHFVEEETEGEDIGGGVDGLAADLFGAGVIETEGAVDGDGAIGIGVIEEFGDAEIEDFWFAFGGDEDVLGFEVAVDDEVGVSVLDSVADFEKETEGGVLGGRAGEVGEEGFAIDILHDEVRDIGGAGAGFEEAGDVGVVEFSEDLFFLEEALAGGVRSGEGVGEEFDGGAHIGVAIDALGEPDDAHAAGAEFADEFPGAEAGAGAGVLPLGVDGLREEVAGAPLEAEELAGGGEGVRGVSEVLGEERVAQGGGEFEGVGDGGIDALPKVLVHAGSG